MNLPTHDAASSIAEAARDMGYKVNRSAASAFSRSAYVDCTRSDGRVVKVRVADHPSSRDVAIDIYVHVGHERPGAVDWQKAVEWLNGKLLS